jgi:hypothetical protein
MVSGLGGGNVVERLLVELGVDANQLLSGVDKATGQAAQMAEGFGTRTSAVMGTIAKVAAIAGGAVAAIFSVRTVTDAISYTAQYADAIRKLSLQTGLTAEQASAWAFASDHVGLSIDDVTTSLGIFEKKLKGIQDVETGVTLGGKSMAQQLADIGIQATDSEGNMRPMGDLMNDLSDYFHSIPDDAENAAAKTGLAMQLFGRSGAALLPLLNLGSQGMADMTAQAKKLGLILSADNVAQIMKYTYAQRDLSAAMGGLKLMIGNALIPVLTQGFNQLIAWQPVIRDKVGKSIQWLTTVFGALAFYIKYALTTGDTFNAYLKGAQTPLATFFLLLGDTVVDLQAIAEWLLKAADAARQWGEKIAGFLNDGKSTADNFDRLGAVVPVVAKAIAALILAISVDIVLGFVSAIAGLALSIITFPLRVLGDIVGTVADFVSTAAKMVNKAVTITQIVARTGAALISGLADVTGFVYQNVVRTGTKIIDKLNPITGTVTQSVQVQTPTGEAGGGLQGWFANLMGNILGGLGGSPEVIKGISNFVSYLGASIGGGLVVALGPTLAEAFGAAAGVLAAIPVAGWIALAVLVVAAIVAALAIAFRQPLTTFFSETLPPLFTEALPQFAASLPGWAGFVAGAVAGALVFALLGIPAMLITRTGPWLVNALVGMFKNIPWDKIGGVFAGLGGLIGGWISGAFKAIPGLLGPVGTAIQRFATSIPGWIVDSVKAIPGLFADALTAIPGLLTTAGTAILDFAKAIPGWIAEAITSLPGILASIPGWVGDAFGAIPGIVSGFLTGAGGLVGIVTGALGDVVGAIMSTSVGQAASWFVGQVVEGFRAGWAMVNQLTDGALNDVVAGVWNIVTSVVGAIASLPGRIGDLAGTFFNAAGRLGDAIFQGIIAGLKAVPGALGDLTSALKDVFKAAINGAIRAINTLIPDTLSLGFTIAGHFIGKTIDIPPNPIPLVDFQHGGIVPGPIGAPVPIMAHGGEEILRAGQRQAPQFNFAWAFSGYDWDAIRRAMHAEADRALDEAMGQSQRTAYLQGAALKGGIG